MTERMFSQRGTALAAAVASMAGLGSAGSALAKQATIMADTFKEMADVFRPIRNRYTGQRRTYGSRPSHPERMVKKALPNGAEVFIPAPPVPEYVGLRMHVKPPSRNMARRAVIARKGIHALPPTDLNRFLAAEAKRARKADRNLTLAHRGAFN